MKPIKLLYFYIFSSINPIMAVCPILILVNSVFTRRKIIEQLYFLMEKPLNNLHAECSLLLWEAIDN